MSESVQAVCHRGSSVLSTYLCREEHRDFWKLDLAAFIKWLNALYKAKVKSDSIFKQRCHITTIKRENRDQLDVLERTVQNCQKAYKESPDHDRLESLTAVLEKERLAEQGLDGFVTANALLVGQIQKEESPGGPDLSGAQITSNQDSGSLDQKKEEKLARASQKLAEIRLRLGPLRKEFDILCTRCSEWQALRHAKSTLKMFEEEIGLVAAENDLQKLFKETGAQTRSSGTSFESLCTKILKESVEGDVCQDLDRTRVKILSNVTLGMASGEIDKMIVYMPEAGEEPVSVLAIAECKHNPNDLAHGFEMMQSNLSWLSGEQSGPHAYKAEAWKTRKYTKGHFDRAAVHVENGIGYKFGPTSFQGFERDPEAGFFLKGVYFATRPSTLTGLDSAEFNVITHRIATDPDFQDALETRNVTYFEKLQAWMNRAKGGKLSSLEIGALYLKQPDYAANILLVEHSNT